MSKKKYNLIYADPPWLYRDGNCQGGASRHYPCLPIQQLCTLPVQTISADNSVLLLWCTFPFLAESLRLIEAWDFRYITCGFVWIKTNSNGKLFMGLGHYTRANAELCLLAKRGKGLKRVNKGILNVQLFRRREHSRKPAEFRDLIINLFGDVPRIELFAREKTIGWDIWGNETGKFEENKGGINRGKNRVVTPQVIQENSLVQNSLVLTEGAV